MPSRAEREALGTYIRFQYVTYLADVAAELDRIAAQPIRHS
jgi:hypothetical protein